MPTIEFNKDDLFDLVGEDMSNSELEDMLARVKVEVEEIEDDRVEVEITSDRIDLLSVEGIARSLRSYLGKDQGLQDYQIHEGDYQFTVENVPARPHVVTAVVRDVDMNTPALKSLIQLQEKLHGTFGRDRERVSIGIHDMRTVSFPLRYRAADPDEYEFVPLQRDEKMTMEEILERHDKGKEYSDLVDSYDRYPVIVDANDDVLSFPPIINAQKTEVTAASEDLFIDVTGTDPDSLRSALNVIVTSLAERGGSIMSVEMHQAGDRFRTPQFETEERHVDIEAVENITGINLDQDQITEYLERMGYGIIEVGRSFEVVIPPYRADILHEVDIAEDVAIGYGYNNIEPSMPDISTIGEEDPLEKHMHLVRETMTGFGFQEIMNPTLTDKETLVDRPRRDGDSHITLANPVSESYSVARDSLLPQLLETLADNTHNEYPQRIFEAADVIIRDDTQSVRTRTDKHLAAVKAGRDTGYNKLRGILEGLLETLDVDSTFEKAYSSTFIEGRTAAIRVDGERIGTIGEVHPGALNNHGVEMPTTAFEINLTALHEQED
ncbi:MAG: phenylalanine--tRNA ligase subunit beta [Candidatus Nanohaloarchaea archaeon]|nr:phenylalanine--tRNA ligase subunit beta [Candidatus Nanohaloarchaea archaeon]